MNKEKRREELDDTFENTFCKLLRQRKGQEGWIVFLDKIISQEQAMIDEAVRNFAIELTEHHKIHLPLTIEYSYLTINTLLKDRGVKKISDRL